MKYEIKGGNLPVVVCRLEAGESMITESGSMVWMSPNMQMDTKAGGMGKILGKMFSGENIFQNVYTARGGEGMIAFGSSFPGAIKAIEVTPDKPLILQKSAFLAAQPGVELSVFFQKKIGAGLFGGEGFIMQKVSGSGIVFVEIDGSEVTYELAAGEQLVADNGYVAMMESTCSIDIQTVKGVKNIMFGGEGLFHTIITGPGRVTMQTMPMYAFVGTISKLIPTS
ncbi:MAG: TIGR00266 family protein [Clostridia bacterium]|nr:TIGR00266 family protein [Clostridia bacterium]